MLKQFDTPKQVKRTFSNLLAPTAQAAKNYGSLQFSTQIGDIRLDEDATNAIPGIMEFRFDMVPGTAVDSTAAVNRVARAFYNYYAQGFTSQLTNVEPADLMVYQLAVSQLYVLLQEGRRVYGCMRKYSNYNAYIAKALVEALGFNYEDFARNLANFRSEFNIRVAQVNKSLHIAPNFGALTFWNTLVQEIFTDNVTEKFQMYAFVPGHYAKWSAVGVATGSALQLKTNPINRTVTDFFNQFDDLFSALDNDTDVTNISGALLRVYSNTGVAQVSELQEDYLLSFTYDPAFLKMIQNMEIVGDVEYYSDNTSTEATEFYIQQRNGALLCIPKWASGVQPYASTSWMKSDRILSFPYENPSPEEVLEACHGKVAYIGVTNSYDAGIIVASSIIVTKANVWYFARGGADSATGESIVTLMELQQSSPSALPEKTHTIHQARALRLTGMLSSFDWHPYIYLVREEGQLMKICFGDVANYTFISQSALALQFDRVMYTMLSIPVNTKSTSR